MTVIDVADTAEIVPSAGPTVVAGATVVLEIEVLMEIAAAAVASVVEGVIVTSSPTDRSLIAPREPLLVTLVELLSEKLTEPDDVVRVIDDGVTALTVPSTEVVEL